MSENNSPTKLGAGAGTIAANPLFQPPSDGDADPHLGVAVAGAVAVAPAAKAKANSAMKIPIALIFVREESP